MINLEQELVSHFEINENPSALQATVHLNIPKDLSYFRGHFPGFQVLPAVAQIDISDFFIKKTYLKQIETARMQKIELVKIRAPVHPEQFIFMQINSIGSGNFQVNWFGENEAKKEIVEIIIQYSHL